MYNVMSCSVFGLLPFYFLLFQNISVIMASTCC